MHELSIVTWVIHISSVLEWIMAIFIIERISQRDNEDHLLFLGFAMIPNLISAMCAITWHIFDNQEGLYGLVTLQGIFTIIGNSTLALASYYIYNSTKKYG